MCGSYNLDGDGASRVGQRATSRLVVQLRASGQDHGLHRGRRAMPKLEIIGSVRSTYTRVVCMVCEEKAIEYVLTEKPLRAPEILAIHPFGKMPVLRHGDVALFESKAIATYLDRTFPPPCVFPSDRLVHRADCFEARVP